LVFGAAVLSVVALGSAQFDGPNQDVVDQAANSTAGEYSEQSDEVTRNVASKLDVGTQTEVVVKGQEHTFEAVFVEENQESAVIRVDGDTESVEVGDVVVVSDTEFEISSLEREGPRTGAIEVRASVQEGDIEFGETEPIQDETEAGDAESGDTSTETSEEEASDGSEGAGRVSPPQQQPGGSAESGVNERINAINRSLVSLAAIVERQQQRINSLEDRIERLETEDTGDQQPPEREPAADNGSQVTQEPEPRPGDDTEEEGILSPITGLVS
jgi:uncharacterized coiled-coil protein SlyX